MRDLKVLAIFLAAALFGQPLLSQGIDRAESPFSKQVDSILSLMTLEEKVGQMTLFTSDWDVTGPTMRENYKDDILSGRTGAIFNAHTAAYNHELQRLALEETRLGLPLIFGYDVIHGYKTIFPIPLGEAATWDLEAITRSARIAAEEASAAGLHWTFAPMVDIARDPRWGRISEGAGEDVYLGKRIAAARVRGFQGSDLSLPNTLAACAKHFAAYGAAQAGRDYHTVDMSDRTLRETYLPPFQSALEAGVRTFMTSFNEVDGIPASGNRYLLTDILRKEWGFDGFVVTDYTSINEMVDHGVAANFREAGELALRAGVDMDMQGAVFYNHLEESLEAGQASMTAIDQAVRRVLEIKYELGLFEDPYRYGDPGKEKALILSQAHLEAARDVARKSLVLLKNDGRLLPLAKDLATIAVIGPLADSKQDMLGNWHAAGSADDCVSLLEGIMEKVGNRTRILHAQGCETTSDDLTGIPGAVDAARDADAIVVAIGEHGWMSGEAASRAEIDLPGAQLQLVRALLETGKPVVAVLMNGRPLAIPWVAGNVPAILETWFAGTQGGHAIADVLFGDYNPSGKLPVTFPRKLGQVPIYHAMKNTGRPMDPNDKYTSKYLDVENTPLYPFGHGLSYTEFKYGPVQADKSVFSLDEVLNVSATLTNTGNVEGTEIVQLYVRDLVGSVTRPVKELKGFQKVTLKAGERKTVRFSLTKDDLAFYTADMTFKAEPGAFEIWIGGSSETDNKVSVTLR